MAAYAFFDTLEITDADGMERYRQAVRATVERHGGRYLGVGGACEVVEGEWRPVFPVLIEFPGMEAARRWYGSEDYRDLKALRLAAARCNAVFIDGSGLERVGGGRRVGQPRADGLP